MSPAGACAVERWALALVLFALPTLTVFAPLAQQVVLPAGALAALAARHGLAAGWRGPARALLPVLAFALLVCLSLLWSEEPEAAFAAGGRALLALAALALFIHLVATTQAPNLPLLARSLAVGLALGAALAALELGTEGLVHALLGREFALYDLNRAVVVQAILVVPLAAWLAARGRTAAALGLVVAMAALAAAGPSQTAPLAFLAGALVLAAASLAPRPAALLLAMALGVGILAAPLLASSAGDLVPGGLLGRIEPLTGQARVEIWEAVAARIAERPALGWGIGGSRVMDFPEIEWLYADGRLPHPHNAPLQVWLDLGLVGALCLAGLALFLAAAAARAPGSAVNLALLAAAAAATLTTWSIWAAWWIAALGTLASAGIVFARLARDQASARAKSR